MLKMEFSGVLCARRSGSASLKSILDVLEALVSKPHPWYTKNSIAIWSRHCLRNISSTFPFDTPHCNNLSKGPF